MKEPINVFDYATRIEKNLPGGALLNTLHTRFDSMVIGWGHLGTLWSKPTFVVYVRDSRFTKEQLDATGEFTVSFPLQKPDPLITRVCGTLSGRDTDKLAEAHLTTDPANTVKVPALWEYPLTLECRVLYSGRMDPAALPQDVQTAFYPADDKGCQDAHTAYVGLITSAYILR